MNFDEKILESLSEEETKIIISHMDLNDLLKPMKNNPQKYSQQIKKLGKMDKRSPLVQKLLPGMVMAQIRHQNTNYCSIVSNHVSDLKHSFADYIQESKIDISLSHDNLEGYASLYWSYKQNANKSSDFSYLCVLLKLVGDELDKTEQLKVKHLINQRQCIIQMEKDYESKINQLDREHKSEVKQINKKHSKEIKHLQQEITNLNDLIQNKSENLERRWEQEALGTHLEKIKTFEEEYEHLKAEQEKKYKDISEQLEKDYQHKMGLILANIEEQKLSVEAECEAEKATLLEEIEILKAQSQALIEKKNMLQSEVETLESRKTVLKTYIDQYFQQFEGHAIQLSLDSLMKTKFAETAFGTFKRELGERNEDFRDHAYNLLLYGGEPIINGEYIDPVEDSEQMLEDLKDNIGLYFEDSYEIAKLVLIAQCLGKIMLVDSFSAKKMGDSLSALTDGKFVTRLDLSDGHYKSKQIIDFINDRSETTILIDGLIDRFDDMALSSIYHGCPEKILIFSYAERDTLDMISKSYLQYCIPLYFAEKLTIESTEKILISKQTYHKYLSTINIEKYREFYKEYFSRMKKDGQLNKGIALAASKFFTIYKIMTSGGKISDLAKDTMLFFIGNNDEAEDNQDLLKVLI